jgi:predicted SnoaL-like aldol condensation-catalyzing enzyme
MRPLALIAANLLAACLIAACPLATAAAQEHDHDHAKEAAAACSTSPEANRKLVLHFYERALVDRKVREAFEHHASEDFIEHKPDIAGGTREATIVFLEGLVKDMPQARWEVLRAAAQDDLVFVHVRFTPAPGAPEYAIVDVFRVAGCRIVEHWDVVAAGPKPDAPKLNPNPRF